MGNMSYCRFQNTSQDLTECELKLAELFNSECDHLGPEELKAAKRLIDTCITIVELFCDTDSLRPEDLFEMNDVDRTDKIKAMMDEANGDAKMLEDERNEEK